MLFNSIDFLGFLAVAALLHAALPARARTTWVLVVSAAFYFTWSVLHAAVLVAATVVAWWAGRAIDAAESERKKLGILWVAVGALLASLATFKYAPTLSGGLLRLAAPLGISYYTFKLVSYVVDGYWGKRGPARGLLDVARYAAFFPQILSGPIQRPADFFAQTEGGPEPDADLAVSGLRLMLFGYFKKLVVADRAALLVGQVYAHPHRHPTEVVWLAAYLYAIQLYADFSGLTDIAIGAGRLFGVRAPKNFDSPYYAPNVQEFWRRWHMSLTTWLGDYVFTPLRMALRGWGNVGLVVAIVVDMVAIGLWHGPTLPYLLFGLINALYVSVSALTLARRNKWFKKRPGLHRVRAVVGAIVVFHLMTVAFIAFRAQSLGDALYVMREFARGMVVGPAHLMSFLRGTAWTSLEAWSTRHVVMLVFGVAVMETVHVLQSRGRIAAVLAARPKWMRWAVYYALVGAILLLSTQESQSFIYYKF